MISVVVSLDPSTILGLFYGGPYHPIPLLENYQYRIRRLRLIVYHHNLHLWYKVVYIGIICGIGVLLEVLLVA
jgi:hypothetical protein